MVIRIQVTTFSTGPVGSDILNYACCQRHVSQTAQPILPPSRYPAHVCGAPYGGPLSSVCISRRSKRASSPTSTALARMTSTSANKKSEKLMLWKKGEMSKCALTSHKLCTLCLWALSQNGYGTPSLRPWTSWKMHVPPSTRTIRTLRYTYIIHSYLLTYALIYLFVRLVFLFRALFTTSLATIFFPFFCCLGGSIINHLLQYKKQVNIFVYDYTIIGVSRTYLAYAHRTQYMDESTMGKWMNKRIDEWIYYIGEWRQSTNVV